MDRKQKFCYESKKGDDKCFQYTKKITAATNHENKKNKKY